MVFSQSLISFHKAHKWMQWTTEFCENKLITIHTEKKSPSLLTQIYEQIYSMFLVKFQIHSTTQEISQFAHKEILSC
jgi:ribosome recycling factor